MSDSRRFEIFPYREEDIITRPGGRFPILRPTVDVRLEQLQLTLPPFEGLSWETEVGFFVDDWQMPFAGVLGHQGFLDRWAVSFNYSQNYFVVEEPGVFHGRLPPDYDEVYQSRDLGWKGGAT